MALERDRLAEQYRSYSKVTIYMIEVFDMNKLGTKKTSNYFTCILIRD